MKLTTLLHPVSMYRMHGAMPPLSHTSSGSGALLSTRTILCLLLSSSTEVQILAVSHSFGGESEERTITTWYPSGIPESQIRVSHRHRSS